MAKQYEINSSLGFQTFSDEENYASPANISREAARKIAKSAITSIL